MNFTNFKLKDFLITLGIALAYPLAKGMMEETNKLLVLLDSTTIISFGFIIFGIINHLYIKGDFDNAGYIINRSLLKTENDYESFQNRTREKRKDSFNYPLLIGILLLIISMGAAYILY